MKQLCCFIVLLSLTTNAICAPTGRTGRNVVNAGDGYINMGRNTTQSTLVVAPTQAQQNQEKTVTEPISAEPIKETPDPELEQIDRKSTR